MKCPKCKSTITESFDPDSIVTCPGCGSRLMTRAAALRSQGGGSRRAKPPPPDPDLTPPVTLPPTGPANEDRDEVKAPVSDAEAAPAAEP
ncbi:MAG: hypothetical protein V3S03_04895, partial [Vicinamibacteria bacterium]